MQTATPHLNRGFWKKPGRQFSFAIEPEEIHVWLVPLRLPEAYRFRLRSCLSHDELARAARFRSEPDQQAAVVSRGVLRHLLGSYLGVAPHEVQFACNAHGKPGLAEPADGGLCFNLSHSHQWAVAGFARDQRVGVDVEQIRAESAHDELASLYFSPDEASRLRSLRGSDRVEAFFECWTRKEAYLKARGDGLTGGLDSFEVSFGRGRPPAILRVPENDTPAARWSVFNLPIGGGYAGALVVDGPCRRLCSFQWSYPLPSGNVSPAHRPTSRCQPGIEEGLEGCGR